MNYEATIRQLRERRDFYGAAVTALEKIQQHEHGSVAIYAETPKRKSAKASAAMRAAWARRKAGANPQVADADILRTMSLKASDAATELGVTRQTIYIRRQTVKRSQANTPVNGSAGDPVSLQ